MELGRNSGGSCVHPSSGGPSCINSFSEASLAFCFFLSLDLFALDCCALSVCRIEGTDWTIQASHELDVL